MPSISIRDIPTPLYKILRNKAAENHRSLNKEVIVALIAHVSGAGAVTPMNAAERLARMRQVLGAAPRLNKRSKAYRRKEADILGYSPRGFFE